MTAVMSDTGVVIAWQVLPVVTEGQKKIGLEQWSSYDATISKPARGMNRWEPAAAVGKKSGTR